MEKHKKNALRERQGKEIFIFLIFISMVFMLNFVSGQSSGWGTVKQGTCINLIQTCSNCTFNNLTSITYPNKTVTMISVLMSSNDGFTYNYTFCDTRAFGEYQVFGYGDVDGINTNWGADFKTTSTGVDLTPSSSIVYFLLFIIIFFVFFIILFFINKLPSSNNKDEEGRILSVNYLKYLRPALWFVEWMLFIAILYLSSNLAFAYLGEQLFANVLFVLFKITFGITPLIVILWFVWMFIKIFHDKQLQKMLNRGIFPQGKL